MNRIDVDVNMRVRLPGCGEELFRVATAPHRNSHSGEWSVIVRDKCGGALSVEIADLLTASPDAAARQCGRVRLADGEPGGGDVVRSWSYRRAPGDVSIHPRWTRPLPRHASDADCAPHLVDGTCEVCGVGQTDVCPDCGRYSYHADGCVSSDASDPAVRA